MELWFVGLPLGNGWMVEGAFLTEDEAARAAKEGEFIVLAEVGERFPTQATQAKKAYYPRQETWEQSALYKLKHNSER